MQKRRLEDVRIPGFHIQRSALSIAPFFSVLTWVGILSLVTEQAQKIIKINQGLPWWS